MMSEHDKTMGVILSTDKLKKFIIRRKWQVSIFLINFVVARIFLDYRFKIVFVVLELVRNGLEYGLRTGNYYL